jgi:hypothetical protein
VLHAIVMRLMYLTCIALCLQVYAFGKTSVLLDNSTNTIRALMGARWAPVALETLMQMQGATT